MKSKTKQNTRFLIQLLSFLKFEKIYYNLYRTTDDFNKHSLTIINLKKIDSRFQKTFRKRVYFAARTFRRRS